MCSSLFSQISRENADHTYENEVIAIYPFIDSASRYKDDGEKITALITSAMVSMNRFVVVDRSNIDQYLKELELQLTGLTDKEVIEAGKIYGYNKAIYGTITSITTSTDRGSYDRDTGRYRYYKKASISVVLNIVDVETTKIIASMTAKGTGQVSADIYNSTALALDEAYGDLVYSIKNRLKDIFKVRLKVNRVDGKKVILLAGQSHGITKGSIFKIYKESDPIVLPNGEIIENTYNYMGSIKVDSLGSQYSIANIMRGRNIAAGDIAEEFHVSGLTFSIFGIFGQYRLDESSSSGITYLDYRGNEYTFTSSNKNIDYSFILGLKFGYLLGMFTPYFSFGLDLFALSYNHFGYDLRFGIDMTIPLYYEIVSFVISPYLGIKSSVADLGEISDSTGRSSYAVELEQMSFGIGALGGFKIGFTDTISMTVMGGYKYYFANINEEVVFDGGLSIGNTSGIPRINFSGWEGSLSFDVLFW